MGKTPQIHRNPILGWKHAKICVLKELESRYRMGAFSWAAETQKEFILINVGSIPCMVAVERWQEGMWVGETPEQLFGGGGSIIHLPKLLPLCPISSCTKGLFNPSRKTVSLSCVTLEMGSQKNTRINLKILQLPPGTGQCLWWDLPLTSWALGCFVLLKWEVWAIERRRATWKENNKQMPT